MDERAVTVVIPAYNEERSIFDTVKSVKTLKGVSQVLVVDDGSSDQTGRLAAKAGARVVRLDSNAGKGCALNAAAPHVTGDVILILDADLGRTASTAQGLLLPVFKGEADMTVAVFPGPARKGGFGLVKGLARAGIRFYTGIMAKAPLSGQRAMTRQVFGDMLPFADGYGVEVALTVKAGRHGYRIKEVPLYMSHRETGRDIKGFLHRGSQFGDVALTLLKLMSPRYRRV